MKKLLLTILILPVLLSSLSFNKAYAEESKSSNPSSIPASDIKSSGFMFDLDAVTHKDIKQQSWIRKGVNFIFERAITIMAATVGGAAVLMMSIGGFMMLASAGRQEMYDKGKSYVFKAVIGIVFVLGAYILVTTIQLLVKSIFTG